MGLLVRDLTVSVGSEVTVSVVGEESPGVMSTLLGVKYPVGTTGWGRLDYG